MINALASTAVHELAHTLGAVHTGVVAGRNADGNPVIQRAIGGNVEADILLAGLIDLDGALSFQEDLSLEIVKLGLAGPWTNDDADAAIDAVAQHLVKNPTGAFSSANHPVLVEAAGEVAPNQFIVFDEMTQTTEP